MRFISTRGPRAVTYSFLDTLLAGLAPDGGLFLPEEYPKVTPVMLKKWRKLSYADLAFEIISLFASDIPPADLRAICHKTYTAETYRFGRDPTRSAEITPLTTLDANFHLLELSNGPTLAFKDMAMQLVGNLFEYALERSGETINILGATSGDTGSAAEYAMRGKHNVRVFMLSPEGKMSAFQRAQMYSLNEPNIFNIAVRGMFDDAQDIVKAVSNDLIFKKKYRIGAVNSMNWARVMAQIVYYFRGFFAATVDDDEQVSFAVPTGNFGNICAGHIAHMMGLPISQLVLATNENDVLNEFFRTGVYRPRTPAETYVTSSPSMDISNASNLERFIFDLIGRDPRIVADLWRQLAETGSFDLSKTLWWVDASPGAVKVFDIVSGSSKHDDRLAIMREMWEDHGLMVDTHTADGIGVGWKYRHVNIPMIVLETAQATKFAETVQEATGVRPSCPAELAGIEDLLQQVEVMDPNVDAVKQFIADHVPT